MAGKTIVVTGGSRGLGFVTGLSLAKKGASVIVLARNSAGAEAARAEIAAASTGPEPQLVTCDLLDFSSVREAASQLKERTRSIDVLCLNAGVMLQPDLPSCDGYDVTISTNVLSHFLLTRELLPQLEQAAAQNGEARKRRRLRTSSPDSNGNHCLRACAAARRCVDVKWQRLWRPSVRPSLLRSCWWSLGRAAKQLCALSPEQARKLAVHLCALRQAPRSW